MNSANYIEKTKKSVIDFIGFKWMEIEIKELTDLVIENVVIEKKIKTTRTKPKADFYFSEEEDSKILKDYEDENNNIMTISIMNNILPWQIVSLLMRYKIINKRDDSRGYNIYKETEEYKSKLTK